MRLFESSWFPVLLGLAILVIICAPIIGRQGREPSTAVRSRTFTYLPNSLWSAPGDMFLASDEEGDLVRYGKELVVHTARYLGPRGIVAHLSNGMNCQNCHLDAGGRPFANPFSAVSSTYPKYRNRSGRVESIEFRVNECMERSMNGQKLDSGSMEMRAMVAYLKWISQGVDSGVRPYGTGTPELPLLDRAADPSKGRLVYLNNCQSCHGQQGQGQFNADSTEYIYPPLWGPNSYNVSAGLHRLSRLAEFIWGNMPMGTSWDKPRLSVEEAWDVSAYISAQPRPERFFSYDWPLVETKPADHPYGPYADGFSEQQHKFGPFGPIQRARAARAQAR